MNIFDLAVTKALGGGSGGSGVTAESLLTNGSVGLKYRFDDNGAYFKGIGECTDTDVVIGNTVLGRPVTQVILGDSVKADEVKSLVIPDSVVSISRMSLFIFPNLESITLPKTSESAFGVFYDGKYSNGETVIQDTLRTVVVTNGSTSYSFSKCKRLTKVVLPGSVVEVGAAAFSDCTSMEVIDFTACKTVPTLTSTRGLKGIPSTCEIRVPAALYDEWIVAPNWSTYASQIVAV